MLLSVTALLVYTPPATVCEFSLCPCQHLMPFILLMLISPPQLSQGPLPDEGKWHLSKDSWSLLRSFQNFTKALHLGRVRG